ncbi:HAD family phosphatase [Megamonas hypermegale]|uniref:HAD family hydrolase n=1 Tax=Megamonas hypermegale TaxID=158847 RepID=UPI00320ADB51
MKAFIFDMDGVIIDTEPLHNEIVRGILAKDNIFVTDEEFRQFTGMASTAVFDIFIKRYNLPHSADQMSQDQMTTLKKYIVKHQMKPIDGIVPLIENLHKAGIPMAIASSSRSDVIKFVADFFNITPYFQLLMSGEDLPHSKPAPDIYLQTAQKLNVAPADCVVLEDSVNGTIAAKDAGMYCIGFANPNSGNQDLSRADIIVNKITDIDITKL